MEKEVVGYDRFQGELEDRKDKIGVGAVFDQEHFLKKKPVWVIDLFQKIDGLCMGVQAGVQRTFLQTYIRYTHRGKMFAKVVTTREHLLVFLRLDYKKLTQKPAFIRDYSKISQQTWVELAFTEPAVLKNETIMLDVTKSLIKQSFERVLKNPRLSKFPSFGKKVVPEFVTSTKFKLEMEIGTDGFVNLGLRCHKSQLPRILEKLME